MKNNIARMIGLTVFALVIAVVSAVSISAQSGDTENQSIDRIVGAWETTVQPVNCDTGEPIGQPFPGVLTFNHGGTVAEFGANPTTPYRTPGVGIWRSEGRGIYSMRFSFMPLTPQGVAIGRLRVTQTGEFPRFSNVQTSSGGFVLTNFQGVVIGTGCSTATAVRLEM